MKYLTFYIILSWQSVMFQGYPFAELQGKPNKLHNTICITLFCKEQVNGPQWNLKLLQLIYERIAGNTIFLFSHTYFLILSAVRANKIHVHIAFQVQTMYSTIQLNSYQFSIIPDAALDTSLAPRNRCRGSGARNLHISDWCNWCNIWSSLFVERTESVHL